LISHVHELIAILINVNKFQECNYLNLPFEFLKSTPD
jgi:hypothetical protein